MQAIPPFAARRFGLLGLVLLWMGLAGPAGAGDGGPLGPLTPWLRLELQQSTASGGRVWEADFDQGGRWSDGLAAGLVGGVSARGRWGELLFSWRGRGGEHIAFKGDILGAWAGLHLGPATLGGGRRSISWARAPGAGVLISRHAPGLDHALIAAEGARLPLIGGGGQAESFVAYLDEGDRAVPYPLLWGMRLYWEPAGWFHLEVQRTIMMGGGGRTEQLTAGDLVDIFLGRGEGAEGPDYEPSDTDQKFAYLIEVSPRAWVREHLGLHDLSAYWFYGGEDRFAHLAPMAPGRTYGLRLAPARPVFFEVEYTTTSDDQNIWYWHKIYRSGYTYEGFILGHPLGPDARRWRGRITLLPERDRSFWAQGIREQRGIHRDEASWLPVPAGGFWRFESGIGMVIRGRELEVTVGAQTTWGGDRSAEHQMRGYVRIEAEILKTGLAGSDQG